MIRKTDRCHRAVPFAVLATVHGLRGIEPQNQSSPFFQPPAFAIRPGTPATSWTELGNKL